MRRTPILIALGLATVLAWAGLAQAHTQLGPGFNLFSTSQDVDLGRKSAAKVEAQFPVMSNPAASRLVERLGARLAANAPGARFPYRFRVLNLSDVNAFSLPGGFIYVHRGLIERVRTEGELAAVLSHEIAHVALRHPTHQVSEAYVAQAGIGILGGLFGGGSRTRSGQIINALGGVGLNTLFMKFSRSAEAEADALGARIMAQSGYDPREMANFFGVLRTDAGRDPSKVAVFLSDHPSPSSREAHILNEAAGMTVRSVPPLGDLAVAQTELRRLPPAPRMQQLAQAQ